MTNPYSLVVLIGLPRSGTTLVHRILDAHSQVDGIIEPYQVRRKIDYSETSVARLCRDFKIAPSVDRALLVKETTTRDINVTLSLDLLDNARNDGIYTALIVLFRSPFEAYLSQIEASRSLWGEKKMLSINDKSFAQFARTSLRSLEHIVRRGRAQHYRLVSYRKFCTDLPCEIARLMGVFPLRFEHEQTQLQLTPPKGGDPKTYTKNTVTYSDRSAEVKKLLATLSDTSLRRQMEAYEIFCHQVETMSDRDAIDRLSELVIMGR